MPFCAVFVDAGYLFAQGSAALTGAQRPRSELRLNESALIAALQGFALEKSEGSRLLRIYWYDAPLKSGVTAEQSSLATKDRIKLRLGVLNGVGQQKGVDSLIVTDLIELARNRAITDAILVSGDEDVRVGAQIAQNYGVCIHLLGMHPARANQSPLLRQEADTTTEWDSQTISTFMSATVVPERGAPPAPKKPQPSKPALAVEERVANVITLMVGALSTDEINKLRDYWLTNSGLPPELDRPMLARCREALERDLVSDEKRSARAHFVERVKSLPEYKTADS